MKTQRQTNQYHKTVSVKTLSDRIKREQALAERLAFGNTECQTLEELEALLPDFTSQKLGAIDSTKESFRKIASGYQKVSDIWLAMGRLLGIEDFSLEQCVLVVCANYLDNLKVRVEPILNVNEPSREHNYLVYFCMADPDFQGIIQFDGDKLSIPENLFDAVVRLRLASYTLFHNVDELLVIQPAAAEEESNMTVDVRKMTIILPLKPTAATPTPEEEEEEEEEKEEEKEEEEEEESSDWGGGDEGEETDE